MNFTNLQYFRGLRANLNFHRSTSSLKLWLHQNAQIMCKLLLLLHLRTISLFSRFSKSFSTKIRHQKFSSKLPGGITFAHELAILLEGFSAYLDFYQKVLLLKLSKTRKRANKPWKCCIYTCVHYKYLTIQTSYFSTLNLEYHQHYHSEQYSASRTSFASNDISPSHDKLSSSSLFVHLNVVTNSRPSSS